jgi:hypothetical protein
VVDLLAGAVFALIMDADADRRLATTTADARTELRR